MCPRLRSHALLSSFQLSSLPAAPEDFRPGPYPWLRGALCPWLQIWPPPLALFPFSPWRSLSTSAVGTWVHSPGSTRLGPGPTRRHPHQEGQGSASDCRVYFVEQAESTGSCSPGQRGAWLSDHLSHSLKQAPLLRMQRLGGSSLPRPGERPWEIRDQEWLSCHPDRERALRNDDHRAGSLCHSKRTKGALRREAKQGLRHEMTRAEGHFQAHDGAAPGWGATVVKRNLGDSRVP